MREGRGTGRSLSAPIIVRPLDAFRRVRYRVPRRLLERGWILDGGP